MKPQDMICTQCGTIARPNLKSDGSWVVELFLWIFFILPGLFYSIWRLTTEHPICSSCKSASVISLDSPMGKKCLKECHGEDFNNDKLAV